MKKGSEQIKKHWAYSKCPVFVASISIYFKSSNVSIDFNALFNSSNNLSISSPVSACGVLDAAPVVAEGGRLVALAVDVLGVAPVVPEGGLVAVLAAVGWGGLMPAVAVALAEDEDNVGAKVGKLPLLLRSQAETIREKQKINASKNRTCRDIRLCTSIQIRPTSRVSLIF